MLEEVHESRRHRHVGRQDTRGRASRDLEGFLAAWRQSARQRIQLVAIAIGERRDRRPKSIDDGHLAGLGTEAQSLARGPEYDLFDVGWRPRLHEATREA